MSQWPQLCARVSPAQDAGQRQRLGTTTARPPCGGPGRRWPR